MQKIYPFKFLDAYTRDDKDYFFGRDTEIAFLYEMIFQTDLLLIYGASGTGKTSLINCGLAGKFESHDWLPIDIRRGNNINESLSKRLQMAEGEVAKTDDDLGWLNMDFETTTSTKSMDSLSPLARSLKTIYLKNFKPIYLIFDQFEELYILGHREEQQQFIKTIKDILLIEQPVKIIISIREEYLGYLYDFEREVPELLRKKLRVEPMHFDKVRNIIDRISNLPQSNVSLKEKEEEAIAETIFDKIRGNEKILSIQLPYLQVFLDKLYLKITNDETRQSNATFSLEALHKIGAIDDVLRDFLDEQVLKIAQDLKKEPDTIWEVLSPFVTLDGTKAPLSFVNITQNTRIDASHIKACLSAFVANRILRYNEREEVYEIKHDSLAKQIHSKRSDEEIAVLEVERLIKSQMAVHPNSRAFLTNKQLAFIAPYKKKLNLTPLEQQYIIDSAHDNAAKQIKQKRIRQLITAASVTAFLMMGMLSFWAIEEQQKTQLALETIERNGKRKIAEELLSFGDGYRDLEKMQDAKDSYLAALDSLKGYSQDSLYVEITRKIKLIE